MDRHAFLAALHDTLRPRGYLEVGVQTGASLRLAQCPALGIDPQIRLRWALPPATVLAQVTSDEFFSWAPGRQRAMGLPQPMDMAFIDGLHLREQALRDFANVERWSNPQTVVVFDDVLPRNQQEATREPLGPGSAAAVSTGERPYGDWTGDVWRVTEVIAGLSPGVQFALVDVEPTGCLVVWGLWSQRPVWTVPELPPEPVPEDVLDRSLAVPPDAVLKEVTAWFTS